MEKKQSTARFEISRTVQLLKDWGIRNDLVPGLKLSAFKSGHQVLGPGPTARIAVALPSKKLELSLLSYLSEHLDRMETDKKSKFSAAPYKERLRFARSTATADRDMFDDLRDYCETDHLLREHVSSLLRVAELYLPADSDA